MSLIYPKDGTWEERGGAVIKALIADLHLLAFQAAGIVGNLGFESAGFQILHEVGQSEGRGGYGWAQWTSARREQFFAWCQTYRYDWKSPAANYSFLLHELRTSQAHALEQIKKTTSLEAAVFTFGYWFERPGGTTEDYLPGYEGRLKYAQRALTGASGSTPPAPEPIQPALDNMLQVVAIFNATAKLLQSMLGLETDGDWGPESRKALLDYLRSQQ